MSVVALAGGVGAGKFLRGLVRAVPPADVTVVVNTGDDIRLHGLHVSPDLDSVTYWLGGVADRERGWGRAGETFRSMDELRSLGSEDAWFNLGDLDLATHLRRTALLASGATLSEATELIARRFGIDPRILPMTNDPVATRIHAVEEGGRLLDLHFQEYWVKRGARDAVKEVVYDGVAEARPAPGVLEALRSAEKVVICPSNPIASIGPILAVPGVRDALVAGRDRVVGISPIVGGAPLRGMADRLMPVAGLEVSCTGAAEFYADTLSAWVIDETDGELAGDLRATGLRVVVTDTIMNDDGKAEALARVALEAT